MSRPPRVRNAQRQRSERGARRSEVPRENHTGVRVYHSALIERCLTALREFGYSEPTDQDVIDALDAFYDGRETTKPVDLLVAKIAKTPV